MNIKIENLTEKYFTDMSNLYFDSYMDKTDDKALMNKYLRMCDFEVSFVALADDNEFIGGIFCRIDPSTAYDGRELHLQSVQVREKFRKHGIAKLLMKKALEKAKALGIRGVDLDVDSTNEFPESWYKELGLKKSKWVSYYAEIEDIKI